MGSRARCAVVGAANIDIGGFSAGRLAMEDSNPGRIALSAGGVGRNIACNLARLGVETHLVAPLGTDSFAALVRADCDRAGVDASASFVFEGAASSAYLFIADAGGEMRLAISDMGICDRLTPEALAERLELLNAMDAVVVDANLSAQALAYLARHVRVPLLADAVSTAKAPRLLGALDRLWAVKPNAIEAEVLTGIPVHDADSAAEAALRLVAMGARRAYITLGERGVCCAEGTRAIHLPGRSARLANATGAGDAFTAALAWGAIRGLSLEDCAAAGLAAAAIAVESMEAVNPGMSQETLAERMGTAGE